jgi:putative protease
MFGTPEVLAPAGNPERLDAAIRYGANAVYLAGRQYGLRSAAGNFDDEQLAQAVSTAHAHGVHVYITCNTLPRDDELDGLPATMEYWQEIGVDAIIVADLGVLNLAKHHAPQCAIHMSTQTGIVNSLTARELHDMGASRVVLARELSMDEIAGIRERTPPELELEAFVHGSMCMAVSGRCMMSAAMTNRDANRGNCTQPCRWSYTIVEEKRPGQYMSVEEDASGTYIFNAEDLNMVEHLSALTRAGVTSFKIEGRAKSPFYVAVITNAYRVAVDGLVASGFDPDYRPAPWVIEELNKVSHRPYGTGFFFGPPSQSTNFGGYVRDYSLAAVVEGWADGRLYLTQRNRFLAGQALEVLLPGREPVCLMAEDLRDGDGEPIDAARHPMMPASIRSGTSLPPGSFVRMEMAKSR